MLVEYGILVSPSANRVYAKSSIRLLQSEIRAFNDTVLAGKVHELAETVIGGVPYISLQSDELTDTDIAYLSNVSSLHALFEIRGDLLRPITVRPLDRFGSDLITIQKYSGKTNEHFTKLLLNVTAVATDAPSELLTGGLRVLDPLCGRGTTLSQAMMYGLDASGIEIDARDFDAYSVFLTTWLKNSRIKHKVETATIKRNNKRLGKRIDVSLGVTKEAFKAGAALRISVIHGDTLNAADFFKPGTFDVIVTDTPYGVQHGSHQPKLARSPVELLERSIPIWAQLLRKGGAIGLSYNTYVAGREELTDILAANELAVFELADFTHRVDQAINRDLLVARKQ